MDQTEQTGIDRQAENEEAKNSLGLLVADKAGELLPDESRDALVAAVLDAGFKSKTQSERANRTSFAQGRENASKASEETLTKLQEELTSLKDGMTNGASQQQVTTEKADPTQGTPQKMDELVSAQLQVIQKEMATLKKAVTSEKKENERLRVDNDKRDRDQMAKKSATTAGIEAPDDALLLVRSRGVEFVRNPINANELLAVRADDLSMPIGGPGTADTSDEYFRKWANTPDGARFVPASQAASSGAGISGGTPASVAGQGPLSEAAQTRGYKDLGYNPYPLED